MGAGAGRVYGFGCTNQCFHFMLSEKVHGFQFPETSSVYFRPSAISAPILNDAVASYSRFVFKAISCPCDAWLRKRQQATRKQKLILVFIGLCKLFVMQS